ncbi:zinc finger BED domain-containing protein RICESLEEPER 2-like [Silene latifolia]|uniref:zinc finger BED domain-containing protein RICESLEEPER 2-like n=1 Tax=Silene latifolia TaxID=37657 RepID=UPI003D782B86
MAIIKNLEVSIPFTELINHVSAYAKYMKDILTKKNSIRKLETIVFIKEGEKKKMESPFKQQGKDVNLKEKGKDTPPNRKKEIDDVEMALFEEHRIFHNKNQSLQSSPMTRMESSHDDNDTFNHIDERVIDVEEYEDHDEEDFEEEVSNKRSKVNPQKSTVQKRARPPKGPKLPSSSSNVSNIWCPGQPFVRNRKNQSPHWGHYVQAEVRDFAECIHCHKTLSCKSSNGTGTISNHLIRCPMLPANVDRNQKLITMESKTVVNDDGTIQTVNVPSVWSFDQEKARTSLAKMIIIDELPFKTVEGEGFKGFCKDMNPQFVIPSRFTVGRDCYKLYLEKRKMLHEYFGKMSSRVCLTTDCWTLGQNLGYMCLNAHFIDADWNLHKWIINFCQIPGHSGKVIGQSVEKCLSGWDLKNVMTITVDNASSNDVVVDYLRRKFNNSECDVMEGKYLHMRCASHILNLVVKEGLADLDKSILKIRTAVKFVRSSPSRTQKFMACAREEKISTKSLLCLDVETRWNSTYLMLETAMKFRKAFGLLINKDTQLQKEMRKLKEPLLADDWKHVSYFLPFLKIFYDATVKMSGSRCVTSNSYVDEIFGVGEVISEHLLHENEGIKKMAAKMKEKYDKYWGKIENLNLLLFVSLILDARWKFGYVDWVVKKAYGQEKGKMLSLNIRYFFQSLFDFYATPMANNKEAPCSTSSTSTTSMGVKSKEGETNDMFSFGSLLADKFELEMGGEVVKKTELEKYLEDDRESRERSFNILQWWKDNQKRYPILSKMARDVLAIPVSTVASESAFSTGGRILDSFRTSLAPSMVEALICAQDWLRTTNSPLVIEDALNELEKLQEGMQDLILEHHDR